MDAPALLRVIEAARTLEVDALWVDAWCYREPPTGYDHGTFVATLSAVAHRVDCVVWLGTAREGALAVYQYRLW